MTDGDARSELIKLAVRKIVEEALEAEVAEAVGRGYYENGAGPGAGYRNGYRRGRLRTAEGAIEYGVPQVADRAEPFVSRVGAGLAGRTAELEQQDHPACVRGAAGAEAHVRRGDPRCRPVARDYSWRVRATAAPRDSRGTRPGSHLRRIAV